MKRALTLLLLLALPSVAYATIPHGGGTIDLASQFDGRLLGGTGEELGGPVAAIGDFSGDGIGDMAVVVYEAPRATVRVIHGGASINGGLADDKGFSAVSGVAISSASRWMTSVAGAGDVNGDGKADLVIGSCDLLAGDSAAGGDGRGWVVFGRSGGDPVAVDSAPFGGFQIDGSGSECLGRAVAGAGDVSGDGKADVILGANTHETTKGRAIVVFGKADEGAVSSASLGSGGFDMIGPSGAFAGTHVAGLGDINGDGKVDVGVGGRGYDGDFGTDSGAVWVVHGRAGGTSVNLDSLSALSSPDPGGFRIEGGGDGARLAGVAPAGDVNSDGKADIVVGAPGPNIPGVVAVVFGRSETSRLTTGGLDTAGYRFTTSRSADLLGFDVRGGGDVNSDGVPDQIAGAPNASVGSNPELLNAGKAFVLYGRPSGGDPIDVGALGTAGVTILGFRGEDTGGANQSPSLIGNEGWMGFGDVTGDGLSDILLGSAKGDLSGGGTDPGASFLLRSEAPAGGGGGTGTGGGTGGGTTTPAPTASPVPPLEPLRLTLRKVSARRIAVGRRPTAINAAKRPPFGMTVRFELNRPATVRFTVTCVRARGKQKKACKKLTAKRRNIMTRKVALGGLSVFAFSGRVGRRALTVGRYRLTMFASDRQGFSSNTVRINFRVVKRR